MGHGIAAQMLFQGTLVRTDQVNLISQFIVFHGNDLTAGVGQKPLQSGQLLQQLGFFDDALSLLFEIDSGGCRVRVCPGEQQSVKFLLRSRNRNDLHYVFFVSILPHGRAAGYTVVGADRVAHHKSIQQGRDQFIIRQRNRLL